MTTPNDNQGYKKLKIYRLAHDLAVRVHKMTVELPQFEMMEEGSQIRRSSKSVSSNIVEGYALRRYKQEYIHYLVVLSHRALRRLNILISYSKRDH